MNKISERVSVLVVLFHFPYEPMKVGYRVVVSSERWIFVLLLTPSFRRGSSQSVWVQKGEPGPGVSHGRQCSFGLWTSSGYSEVKDKGESVVGTTKTEGLVRGEKGVVGRGPGVGSRRGQTL